MVNSLPETLRREVYHGGYPSSLPWWVPCWVCTPPGYVHPPPWVHRPSAHSAVACRTMSGKTGIGANPSTCRTDSYWQVIYRRARLPPVSLLVGVEREEDPEAHSPCIPLGRGPCCEACSLLLSPVSLLDTLFVRARNYTFRSERGDQAALCGGTCHAAHHPFHCRTVRYTRNLLFR